MENCIPLFTTHYSIGRSILTVDSIDSIKESGPDSIIKICKDYGINDCIIVDNNMSGFAEMYKETKAAKLSFCFGLKVMVCAKIEDKSDESFKTEHKIVIFAKSQEGYKDLIKIYSLAATDGFYYIPRIDLESLAKLWTKNLELFIPFYDSYIYKSVTTFSSIIPFIDFCKPKFFIEDNLLPLDETVKSEVVRIAKNLDCKTFNAKTIYYKTRQDFETYLVYRAIFNRSTFDNPKLQGFSSPEFCVEAWKESLT